MNYHDEKLYRILPFDIWAFTGVDFITLPFLALTPDFTGWIARQVFTAPLLPLARVIWLWYLFHWPKSWSQRGFLEAGDVFLCGWVYHTGISGVPRTHTDPRLDFFFLHQKSCADSLSECLAAMCILSIGRSHAHVKDPVVHVRVQVIVCRLYDL